MARDDLFRRSFEAGTAFVGMTRERAEALVKELVKAGEVQKGKAQKAIDELLDRSRKATEELRQLIGHEIADQVAALGVATRDDLASLERRLDGLAASITAGSSAAVPAKTEAKTEAETTATATTQSDEPEATASEAATQQPGGEPPPDGAAEG